MGTFENYIFFCTCASSIPSKFRAVLCYCKCYCVILSISVSPLTVAENRLSGKKSKLARGKFIQMILVLLEKTSALDCKAFATSREAPATVFIKHKVFFILPSCQWTICSLIQS